VLPGTSFTTDGDVREGPYLYVIAEAKVDFGQITADPYIQSTAYHAAALKRIAAEVTRPLPCIHIFYAGKPFVWVLPFVSADQSAL
jgi:hypothetical protein